LARVLGLLVGFSGTLLLVGASPAELRAADWRGPIALTVATIFWAAGSIVNARIPSRGSPYVSAAIQMLAGGMGLILVRTAAGEWPTFLPHGSGLAAMVYLVLFGSIVAFTAYTYVLRHWPTTIVSTYAYLNVVVAVLLGWLLLSEPVTLRTGLSMTLVFGAVLWVKRSKRRGRVVTETERRAAQLAAGAAPVIAVRAREG